MREYELTIILKTNIEESVRNELVERIVGWLTRGDENAPKPVVNHWGKRHMAYAIKKHTDGYYLFIEAQLDPAQLKDIERNMQFTEDILRYMFVRKEE
ncbi:MAG: 30S ribosomal protein S6 [Chloroflexota bacterium]|jgi:small subunit ribosomal protein S6